MPIPRRLLVGWNVAMCCFHTALAALTLVLGNRNLQVDVFRTAMNVTDRAPRATAARRAHIHRT